MHEDPDALLPTGTRVVVRVPIPIAHGTGNRPVGTVGEIVEAPLDASHPYRVRLADDAFVSLPREHLAVLRVHQRVPASTLPTALEERALVQHVIYRCVVGSRAYGLDEPGSDFDRRGIYLPPAERHW